MVGVAFDGLVTDRDAIALDDLDGLRGEVFGGIRALDFVVPRLVAST